MRLASPAGHVMGHALTSSETCTWLREHWKVARSYTKPEIDRLFVNGINHILYHGSPDNEILIYWPAADIWDATTGPLLQQLGVHEVKWLTAKPTGLLGPVKLVPLQALMP